MVSLSDSEKLILLFLYIWKRPINVVDLFKKLNKEYHFDRSRQTLHSSIKKLRKGELVSWEPHKSVILTEQGKELALHFNWHMHLLERYFHETLDLPEEIKRKETIRLTPIISCDFVNAVKEKFDCKDNCELLEAIKTERICLNERRP